MTGRKQTSRQDYNETPPLPYQPEERLHRIVEKNRDMGRIFLANLEPPNSQAYWALCDLQQQGKKVVISVAHLYAPQLIMEGLKRNPEWDNLPIWETMADQSLLNQNTLMDTATDLLDKPLKLKRLIGFRTNKAMLRMYPLPNDPWKLFYELTFSLVEMIMYLDRKAGGDLRYTIPETPGYDPEFKIY